jgi:hypothetical protein
MHNSKFIIFISGCLFLLVSTVRSQSEYLAELGVNGGISYLLDDKNSVPFNNTFLELGLIYRHNFNERLSAHLAWNNTRNIYFNPLDTIMLNIIDLCGEFNFFDLIKRQYKPRSTNFSPYIFAGAGFAFNQQTSGFNIPFGVGIKYKLGSRFNLNAQWAHRLMLNTDKLEGIESALNGSNFMNKDLISTFTIGLSYDFWKRPCDCKTKF